VAKTIQVRDVPDDVHHRLLIHAAEEQRSLSEFIRLELIRLARKPTLSEMLQRLERRPVLNAPESAAEAIRAERGKRSA
jgi:predicted CopG family antitoxin